MLAIMALSASLAIPTATVFEFISIIMYCYSPSVLQMFLFVPFYLLIFYFVFYHNGKAKAIIDTKPKIYNENFSIVFTIMFFIITLSFVFWGGLFSKHLLNNCG